MSGFMARKTPWWTHDLGCLVSALISGLAVWGLFTLAQIGDA
jgi:hypothetical protein